MNDSISKARERAEQDNSRLPYRTGAYDDTWEVVSAMIEATPVELGPVE